ncbi:hypothetical protein FDENT_1112 [Fusarium denticulatum]|uniref:Ipa protein n=1 Tax=Fusarium denticulatum TaxID=48507 RepID=A0A8H6CWC6_9HYPO|nr:hypothetical protein FDENT_1112 [Fusarium denticulatum]
MAACSEMLRELHGDLQRKWAAYGLEVETAWRSFDKAQRAKCMKAAAWRGQVLKHSRDASLGILGRLIPEWNLTDMTDPDSDLFLDIIKHRAMTPLTEQYRCGHNDTAGDLALIDEMARTRSLRHENASKNVFTVFNERDYGDCFRVPICVNNEEVLSGLELGIHHRYIVPQPLGKLILTRQILMVEALNLMIKSVLVQVSRPKDRSQPKNFKPPTAPVSDSHSKQATVKLHPQELFAIASDQKSSREEFLSLLCSEPRVLCADVNAQFYSRPELVPDEKGRSLPVHIHKDVGPAVFETIYHVVQGIATWESITALLDLLERPSTDKPYKSTVLQELSNLCHFEYARTQALFKRRVSTTRTGSKWFKRISNAYDNLGNAKVSMKGKPEELTRSNPHLHYLLRLCQPDTTVTKAAEWMEKLSDLYIAHPLEREKLGERESRTLHDVAAIVAFVQDLSAVYSLPSTSRKKGNRLEVDLRDYAAPIENLLEPSMSVKALEVLDAFIVKKTGTRMASLYQDELDKAFRNVEERYRQAKDKTNKDTKAEFVPIDTTSMDSKERIEARRQKEKTRPEHSSVYATTSTTQSSEEKEPVKPTQPLKVSSSTAEVFATLFDKTQSRGSVSWSSFEAAMSELGFSVLPRLGSVYTFRPSEDMEIKKPVSIHRPHQSQIEGYLILILARRLNRAYGWSEDSFVTE